MGSPPAWSASAEEVMSLFGFPSIVAEDPQLQHALEYAGHPGSTDADLVAPPALRPILIASLAALSGGGASTSGAGQPRFLLAITATAREAEDLASALSSLL